MPNPTILLHHENFMITHAKKHDPDRNNSPLYFLPL